jgi:tetratricopeptide (TPR) repeat protein
MPKPLPLLIVLAAIALGPAAADEPPATAEELIRAAETQLSQQDFDGAIATLTRALDADPESTLAHTRLGGAYLMTQRYDSAIEQFQQAIASDADNAGAFIGMGMAYLHQGRAGPAKAALTEAKRLAPDKAAEIDDLITSIEQGTAGHP